MYNNNVSKVIPPLEKRKKRPTTHTFPLGHKTQFTLMDELQVERPIGTSGSRFIDVMQLLVMSSTGAKYVRIAYWYSYNAGQEWRFSGQTDRIVLPLETFLDFMGRVNPRLQEWCK